MRNLRVVVHVQFVAVILGEPLPGKAKARVYPDPLVRYLHSVTCRLIRNRQAFLSKSMNASRARCAEPSRKLRITFHPRINRACRWHTRIGADASEWLAFLKPVEQFNDLIVIERLGHECSPDLARRTASSHPTRDC